MNLLLLLAHSIAEYDDVRMFTDLGYDVFSIGAYTNPRNPGDDKRPALPSAPYHPELEALVPDQMAAKAHLPDELVEWADVIVVHHFVREWIAAQWPRIRHKRVVWRTCGQSDPMTEAVMKPLRHDGLTIVRYSPRERLHFEAAGSWAGSDAVIRFGKYPEDYGPWTGELPQVANVTQDMAGRGEWCGYSWYLQATEGLEAAPAGPGSEQLPGGIGALSYPELVAYLRHSRAYVYTGTVAASYTLGLMEALLSGVPTVSIGANAWRGPSDLWEGSFLTGFGADSPEMARDFLRRMLASPAQAADIGAAQRELAVELFDVATVGQQWVQLLGEPR